MFLKQASFRRNHTPNVKKTPQLGAFSLLEISFVLIIMGMISIYTIPAFMHMRVAAKIRETEEKLDALTFALASYALIHQCLPAPANPAAPYNDNSNTGLVTGIVPFRKLGIQEKEAKDGFKNWISYSVSPALEQQRPMPPMPGMTGNTFCQIPATTDDLIIHDVNGKSMLKRPSNDLIAFVLISHGPRGEGAFDNKGQRQPTHHPSKDRNRDETHIFIDAPVTKDVDDRVRWVTRDNLMAIYAKRPCLR